MYKFQCKKNIKLFFMLPLECEQYYGLKQTVFNARLHNTIQKYDIICISQFSLDNTADNNVLSVDSYVLIKTVYLNNQKKCVV